VGERIKGLINKLNRKRQRSKGWYRCLDVWSVGLEGMQIFWLLLISLSDLPQEFIVPVVKPDFGIFVNKIGNYKIATERLLRKTFANKRETNLGFGLGASIRLKN
jgi:hypothetical protein